jgi:hypothetical protein
MYYIVFILQCQKTQATAKLCKRAQASVVLIVFLWCPVCIPLLYCSHFLLLRKMNQEEKIYILIGDRV